MALPPLPAGLSLDTPAPSRRRTAVPPLPAGLTLNEPRQPVPSQPIDVPTGDVHDGDTFRLRSGENMRLFGVDAFELAQQGRAADESPMYLGREARERTSRFAAARERAQIRRTGGLTYGRPVGTLGVDGEDAGAALLHDGLALATPKYLRSDMPRLTEYMQEERLARLNRRGAHAGTYQTPEDYRHNGPAPGEYGNAQAVFWDEATPSQGLPAEQERGLMAIWQDMTKGPADYVAYAKANGIEVDPKAAEQQFGRRDRAGKAGGNGIPTVARPRVLTDPGDGRLGATLRGFADPINMLDEAGAVVDSLLPGGERENIWSSDRRFGDVYANNLEQNRSILDHDEKEHEWWRFGGQLASGLALPGASVEGVGFASARAAMRGGASRFAAEQAARRAVVRRLAGAGAIEGGAAGAGQGETATERVQGAAIGAPAGGALGVGAGVLAPRIAQAVGRPFSRLSGRAGERSADDFASGAVDAGKALGNNDAQSARTIDLTRDHLNGPARAAIRRRRGLDPEQGAYGPIFFKRSDRWSKALSDMEAAGSGEVPAAIKHPELGRLDAVWGDGSFGVSRLAGDDPASAKALPQIVAKMRVVATPEETANGVYVLSDGTRRAVVAPEMEAGTRRLLVRDVRPERSASDRIDAQAVQSDRQRDRIDATPLGREPEPRETAAGAPLDTAAPARSAPPPRSIDEVLPDIEAWAAARGAARQSGEAYPDVMLHGSPRPDIDQFDPYGKGGYGLFGAGTYLTDTAQIAASYSKKGLSKAAKDAATDRTLYAVRQAVKNPLDMDAPASRETWETAARRVLGDWGDDFFGDMPKGASNERYWREVEDHLSGEQVTADEGRETMDALVRSLGHDGITHVGGGRVDADGVRHRVVIALDPEQTEIVDRLSVGSMLNPPAPRSPDWIDANAPTRSTRHRDRLDMPAAAIASEVERPSIYAPDAASIAPDGAARPRSVLDDASDAERAAAADRVASRDVLPLPSNAVDGVEEAARIERGRYDTMRAPNEAKELAARSIPHARTGTPINVRGPLDLSSWLRMEGGIKPVGGELEHLGITNAPRRGMDLTGGDRLGPLVAQDGMSYDDAAYRAWEAGFFPDRSEPPSINEFLDALDATHSGRSRLFRADEMPEVDAFYGARRQRYDVERAADQGAPLTSDRGQPVGPDDLDANAPPVRAYEEWGENAPNLAGNIRLDKLDSPQAIKRALTQTEKVAGGFDAARRGRITQAETQSLANELGMTPDDLLKRRKGQAFNAEEALAARQILARSATDLVNMAKRIARSEDPGDEVEAAFREAWLRHAAIQEQVSGMTAEAGRSLQQFRQTADARQVGRVLPSLGDIAGGSARLKDVADKIVNLEAAGTAPGGINRFAVKALRVRKRDMLMEYYINALLSGPQTHATNILSNTLTALAQLPEHTAAAAVGIVRRGGEELASRLTAREIGSAERVMFSEVGGRFTGLVQGTREGLRDAIRTLRTGDAADAVVKVENQQFKAIPGMAGEIVRLPSRFLSAEDELFKGMARRMELTGLAMRKASAEGLRGDAARTRVGELLENPTDEMMDRALDYARYLTFQSPLGTVTSKIAGAANSSPLLKFLIPFVRTPTNLLKFAMERSPAAPLLKEWRTDMAAGGAKRDLAVARALVGTGIGAMFYEAALDGRITGGGPADDSAKRLMLADGWQPYSVRVGDKYYSYRRLDPFSTTIGTVADMVDLGSHMTERQREKSGTLVTAAILNNLASKTWLTGISGIAEALADPDRNWTNFLARTAGAVAVPAFAAQVTRTIDPVIREARSPIDRIRSRTPGLSDDLFPRRDIFGEPVTSGGGLGPDIVSPVWTGEAKNDPTIKKLVDAGVTISVPPRFRKVDGKRKEWTPAEYDRLQVAVGDRARQGLAALVRSDGWKTADDDAKQSMVSDLMRDARKAARQQVESVTRRAPDQDRGTAALPAGLRLAPTKDLPALPPGMALDR